MRKLIILIVLGVFSCASIPKEKIEEVDLFGECKVAMKADGGDEAFAEPFCFCMKENLEPLLKVNTLTEQEFDAIMFYCIQATKEHLNKFKVM